MKNKILITLTSLLASAAIASAHCGQCATDKAACENCAEGHAEHHASCADGLLGHYFQTQEALAGDNLKAAQTAADGLLADYQASTCSTEGESCCLAVGDATQAIIDAPTIKDARAAFKTISETLIPMVEAKGVASGKAYLAYCPMAFGNTGASWLQNSKSIANPYFGSMMFSCGVIKGDLSQKAAMESHEHHNAHQH